MHVAVIAHLCSILGLVANERGFWIPVKGGREYRRTYTPSRVHTTPTKVVVFDLPIVETG